MAALAVSGPRPFACRKSLTSLSADAEIPRLAGDSPEPAPGDGVSGVLNPRTAAGLTVASETAPKLATFSGVVEARGVADATEVVEGCGVTGPGVVRGPAVAL